MQMYGMILLLAGVVMSVISSSNGGVVSSYPSYDCSGANMRDPKYRDLCLTLNKIVSALSPNSPNDINEAGKTIKKNHKTTQDTTPDR